MAGTRTDKQRVAQNSTLKDRISEVLLRAYILTPLTQINTEDREKHRETFADLSHYLKTNGIEDSTTMMAKTLMELGLCKISKKLNKRSEVCYYGIARIKLSD